MRIDDMKKLPPLWLSAMPLITLVALIIIVLIQTDFPDPVAPAIKRCGIFAISVTIVLPAISFPTANDILDFES